MSKKIKKHSSSGNQPLLAESVDEIVTPWLLVTLLVIMGLFVVLQYLS